MPREQKQKYIVPTSSSSYQSVVRETSGLAKGRVMLLLSHKADCLVQNKVYS